MSVVHPEQETVAANTHETQPGKPEKAKKKLLYVPCRQLEWSAPFRWLKLGWQDYKTAPLLSVSYGAFFALMGLAITALLWYNNSSITIFSFGILFILLGPIFAFGLYDVSKNLQLGQRPSLKSSLFQMRKNASYQWVYASVLISIGLLWMRAATIIHVFYPQVGDPTLEQMASFLTVGIGVGAFFSVLVFSTGMVSLPMMMDRGSDTITAVLTSIRAVLDNTWITIFWAAIIVFLVLMGFATGFLGFVVVLPLVGYATFHAYQDTVLSAEENPER